MSNLDKYRSRLRTERYESEQHGIAITLAECGGRAGFRLAGLWQDAIAKADGGKIGGDELLGLFVESIAASVVEEDGSRPLDSDEGRAVVAEWPGLAIIAAGEIATRVNGFAELKKS